LEPGALERAAAPGPPARIVRELSAELEEGGVLDPDDPVERVIEDLQHEFAHLSVP
jgi:hypothetical protein